MELETPLSGLGRDERLFGAGVLKRAQIRGIRKLESTAAL